MIQQPSERFCTTTSGNRVCCRRTGFTLIEVLVVVAIIALLISILLPSLAAARRQARTTVCGNDVRQMGMAANLFSTENRNRVPRGISRHGSPDGSAPVNWVRMVARMLGDRNDYADNFNRVPVEKHEVFSCPERSNEYGGSFLDYVINSMDTRGPMNLNPCTPNPTTGYWYEVEGVTKIDLWDFPAETVYVTEAVEESWNIVETNNSSRTLRGIREDIAKIRQDVPPTLTGFDWFDVPGGNSLPTFRKFTASGGTRAPRASLAMHRNGSNAVFVDGHVEIVKPPRESVGELKTYEYYMRRFGVDRTMVTKIRATNATANLNDPCVQGDTKWRPGQ